MSKFVKTNLSTIICTIFLAISFNTIAISDNLERLYVKGEHKQLVEQVKVMPAKSLTPEVYNLYIYSLASHDLDDAEEAAEQAISHYPDDPDLYLVHADIMGKQAQDSIFSALSYAEKALTSLQKATQLAPNHPKYLDGLMSFYLAAPSIAGGDTDLALAQAKAIGKLDAVKGMTAMARYYSAVDKSEDALKAIQSGFAAYPNNMELPYQLANIHVSNDQYDSAIEAFLLVLTIEPKALTNEADSKEEILELIKREKTIRLNTHYQIGRVALIGKTQIQQGIDNLNTYMMLYKKADFSVRSLPSLHWANLRKAGLLMELKQPVNASKTLKLVNVETDSNMKKIHKKLHKKIKKALKKLKG